MYRPLTFGNIRSGAGRLLDVPERCRLFRMPCDCNPNEPQTVTEARPVELPGPALVVLTQGADQFTAELREPLDAVGRVFELGVRVELSGVP